MTKSGSSTLRCSLKGTHCHRSLYTLSYLESPCPDNLDRRLRCKAPDLANTDSSLGAAYMRAGEGRSEANRLAITPVFTTVPSALLQLSTRA